MTIKAKSLWAFGTIILMAMLLGILTIMEVNKSSKGFSRYRKIARHTVLASRVQANMLMVRISVKNFLLNPVPKKIDEFESSYKKTRIFIDKALKEFKTPQRLNQVKKISNEFLEYHKYFHQVVNFYKKRNDIVHNNLDVNGKKIEKLLTFVMKTAKADNDLKASVIAGESIRTLLLARLYTIKYLLTNKLSNAKRVETEFINLQNNLRELKKEIQNPIRRSKLTQAINLIDEYRDGVKKIIKIIYDRNEIINDKLNVIGPRIAKLAENIKLSLKREQDIIGPQVEKENENVKNTAMFAGFFIIIIVLAIAFYMVKTLELLENLAKELSENDGDLTKRLKVKGKDEIAIIANYINEFIEKVQKAVNSVKESSNKNREISRELAENTMRVGKNVDKSVKNVDETLETINEIKYEVNNVVSITRETKKEIEKANKDLNNAKSDIINLSAQVEESAGKEIELAQNIQRLSDEANSVKGILDIISDIADQTNLLALNAAIEAARAGEHGRGFAVVADEVRQLAEKTQKALSEINSTINVVVQSISEVSMQMNKNSDDIQNLVNIASETEEKIASAVTMVNNVTDMSNKVAEDVEQTEKNTDIIVDKTKEINEMSSANAKSIKEIVKKTEVLNQLAEELNNQLETTFKT